VVVGKVTGGDIGCTGTIIEGGLTIGSSGVGIIGSTIIGRPGFIIVVGVRSGIALQSLFSQEHLNPGLGKVLHVTPIL
jgi:hypothetical protein